MKSYLDAEEQLNDEYRKIFLSNEEYEEYEASNKTLHQRSKTPEEKKKRKALNDKINKHYNSIGRFAYGEEDYNRARGINSSNTTHLLQLHQVKVLLTQLILSNFI